MRYTCTTCRRVFHLETQSSAPCPYCSGELEAEQTWFDAGPSDTVLASSEDLEPAGWSGGGDRDPEPAPAPDAAETAMLDVHKTPVLNKIPAPLSSPASVPSPSSMITTDLPSPVRPDSYRMTPGPKVPQPDPDTTLPWSPPAASPPPPPVSSPIASPAAPPAASPRAGLRGEVTRVTDTPLADMAQTAPNLFRGGRPVSRATARARPADTRSGSRTILTVVVAVVFGAAAATAAIIFLLPHLYSRGESAKVEEAEKRAAEFDKARKLLKAQRDEAYAQNKRLRAANAAPAGETAEKSDAEAGGGTDGKPDGKPDGGPDAEAGERQAAPPSSEAVDMTLASLTLLERRVDLELALALADTAVRSDPALPGAHRVRGGVLAALGRAKEALAAFEEASEAARKAGLSGDIEALVLAAEVCLTHLGDSRMAAARYAEAAAVAPGSPVGLAAKAAELRIKGDLDGAAAEARKAREAVPSLALASLVLGEIAFERALLETGARRRDLLAEAGPLLAEAVRLDPNSARACLVRGRMLIEEGELTAASRGFGLARFESQGEAVRLLQRATKLSPDLTGAYVALADLRLKKGALRDPAAAVKLARDAVKLTAGKDVEALVTLAAARAATGNPSAAARAVKEALKLAPKDGDLRKAYRKYRSEARAIGR